MNKFQKRHKKLIESAGGKVEGIFVKKVGVMLTKKPVITEEAKALFDIMNIDNKVSEAEQHAEFNSRITYLSFKEEKSSAVEYNNRMIKEFGHRSVYNDEVITFLVAGLSVETILEFVAHDEATIARLTSSKTNAQNEALYRIRNEGFSEEFIELQKKITTEFLKLREQSEKEFSLKEQEVFNVLNLGNKVVSFTISMSIKDWHKVLIGRLSHQGVESEMIEVLNDIVDILNKEYPNFFNTKEEYFGMGNSKKYDQE